MGEMKVETPIFTMNNQLDSRFKTEKFGDISPMKETAFNICRKFLTGSWKKIQPHEMLFQPISGGLSNILFKCSLPAKYASLNEPSQVLLRIYGQLRTDDDATQKENKMTESIIFMLLSERNLGPKLHGIFPGGRLEEYIPARAMTCSELRDPTLSSIIARKLAHIHSLDVPINKEPSWIFEQTHKWAKSARQLDTSLVKEEHKLIAQRLINADFESELKWLEDFLTRLKSPVVFCHNDLHEGNILLPEPKQPNLNGKRRPKLSSTCRNANERVIFIDFEFCSYNYRGYDFANHFWEWAIEYSYPEYPYFCIKLENFPSLEERRHFIREYLTAIDQTRKKPERDSEDHILEEAQNFLLASHIFWTLWSINMSLTSEIPFGYWEYALVRFDAYQKHKAFLLQNSYSDKSLE